MSNDYNPWAEPQSQASAGYPASQGGSNPSSSQNSGYSAQSGQAAYPAQSQSSASYPPQSQSSASYPAQSQASASSYPSEQQGGYGNTGGASSYGPGTNGSAPAEGSVNGQPVIYGVERNAPGSGNNLGALFDFGFKKFATRSLVKILYILCLLLALAIWLLPVVGYFSFGGILSSMASGSYGYGSSSSSSVSTPFMLMGVFQLILGWIPALVFLIFARMTCEFYVFNQQQAESLERLELK